MSKADPIIDDIISRFLAGGSHSSIVFSEVKDQDDKKRSQTIGTCPFCQKMKPTMTQRQPGQKVLIQ